jgi:Tfp pilus assembly protein PilF
LGYRALLEKNWPQAIALLERSASLDDKNVMTLTWLAQGYQNSGNKAKAIELYRRVLSLQPDNADARNGLKVLGA